MRRPPPLFSKAGSHRPRRTGFGYYLVSYIFPLSSRHRSCARHWARFRLQFPADRPVPARSPPSCAMGAADISAEKLAAFRGQCPCTGLRPAYARCTVPGILPAAVIRLSRCVEIFPSTMQRLSYGHFEGLPNYGFFVNNKGLLHAC